MSILPEPTINSKVLRQAFAIARRAELAWCILMPVLMPGVAAAQPGAPQQPFTKLPDGRTVLLNRIPSEAEIQRLRPPTPPLPPDSEPAPPASVDLTADQTGVRDQGGRDTCGTFGTTAALEAAYKRAYHVDLDLSEQYLNHWGQIMAGAGSSTPLPESDSNAGAIGGGGLNRPLSVLMRGIGVPTEEQLPYVAAGEYQNSAPGDRPDIMSWWLPHKQREVDDFNLASVPASYVFKFPDVVTTTIMPQAALEGAHYGVTGARIMGPEQLHDLDVWRRILASHREIIMEFQCCTQAPFSSSGGLPGGHVVLVVGYDDARRALRIKNSWGPGFGENGYAWVNYQYVTGTTVYNAGWIDGVAPQSAQADVWTNKQLWLGRWRFDFDGWKGLLDIYNLPSGSETVRLGTLFLDDGRIFRVNGTQKGNLLTASVDWTQPNLPANQPGPTKFSLYLFSWDHESFAGTQSENGNIYAVEGLKIGTFSNNAAPGALNQGSWFGVWDATIDGRRGVLNVTSVNWATGALSATYTPNGGTALAVHAWVSSDPRVMTMTIDFPTPQSFSARLNGHEWGVMSGTTVWNNLTFGWLAMRRVGAGQPPPPPPTSCQLGCGRVRDDCMAHLDGGTPQMCVAQYQACMRACGGL